MLKFLTQKLKTHSLNEDHLNHYKADDDHDSGTESDDEIGDSEDPESSMDSEPERSSGSSVSPGPYTGSATACNIGSPYFLDSALPSDSDHNSYDHHSSEEELEVINSSSNCLNIHDKDLLALCRSGSATVPEKRKWSQITHEGGNTNCDRTSITPPLDRSTTVSSDQSSGSSDEEVQGLLAEMATPVQFRTSPPLTAHKPGHRSQSPPLKLFHYGGQNSAVTEVSPRKRHRHTPRPHHIQRPCLDFEKMQQLKARAVTAWRHSGDHGGELSVFCW